MKSPILRYLIFLSLVSLVVSSHSGSLSERNNERKAKSLFVLLADFWNWTTWFVRSILSLIYFVINTIALTITQIMSMVVSIPQKVIDLIEFVGYCVRFALKANYNFVSSVITIIRRFLENCCVFTKDLVISTFAMITSLFKMILQFFHKVVFSFPKLYGFAGTGVQTSANVVGALAVKTNSTFRGVFASITAVLELFGRSIVNTVLLITDLITHTLISCGKLFQYIGRNIICLTASAYRVTVRLCQTTGAAVKSFSGYILNHVVSLFERGKKFVQAVFSTIAAGLLTIFQTVGLFVIKISSFVFSGFKQVFFSLSYAFSKTYNNLENMVLFAAKTYKESNVSYIYASLSLVLAVCLLFIVQKLNVLNVGFVFLETMVQSMILRVVTATHKEPITNQEAQSCDDDYNTTVRSHGDVEHLQKQLQRERDKNLCVVCQDQLKKVLLLPCRHMCICMPCANHITSSYQRIRRVCPLCRSHIVSTVEVYS